MEKLSAERFGRIKTLTAVRVKRFGHKGFGYLDGEKIGTGDDVFFHIKGLCWMERGDLLPHFTNRKRWSAQTPSSGDVVLIDLEDVKLSTTREGVEKYSVDNWASLSQYNEHFQMGGHLSGNQEVYLVTKTTTASLHGKVTGKAEVVHIFEGSLLDLCKDYPLSDDKLRDSFCTPCETRIDTSYRFYILGYNGTSGEAEYQGIKDPRVHIDPKLISQYQKAFQGEIQTFQEISYEDFSGMVQERAGVSLAN